MRMTHVQQLQGVAKIMCLLDTAHKLHAMSLPLYLTPNITLGSGQVLKKHQLSGKEKEPSG